MKFPSVNTVFLLGALLQTVSSTTPPQPSLSYLGTARINLKPPIQLGVGPLGARNIFPINGGSFSGPNLTATIPVFGGDWGLGDPTQGNFYVDAKYQLETPDGAHILVEANGPQQPEGVVHTRNKFETGHPDYYWLNNVVAIGIVQPTADVTAIVIDLWRMHTPEGLGCGGNGTYIKRGVMQDSRVQHLPGVA
ncbi:hypothetical protein OQA88_2623 [Cercophora sp. LCS_1]